MTLEATARKAQAKLEPFIGMIYFVPEGPANYQKVGLEPRQAYFCSRSAAMGAVPGEVVAATFYNFNPALVIPLVNDGWQKTTPQATAAARDTAVIEALTRILADENGTLPDVSRTIEQVHKACEGLNIAGRPLFAGHVGQPWPTHNPLLSLWWGVNLLREYRGDGHIAALMSAGISGIEATILQTVYTERGAQLKGMLFKTRAWSPEEMAAAYAGLEARGLMDGETLNAAGRALRDEVEATTDKLAVKPWENLGDEAEEFITTIGGFSKRILESGALGAPRR